MEVAVVREFVLEMSAKALLDELTKAMIPARIAVPTWTNKRLPPPKIRVEVPIRWAERARELEKGWRA